MRVLAYPADDYGCGHHRLIWPCQYLAEQGHAVEVVTTADRHVRMAFDGEDRLVRVDVPEDVDVFVFQRTTDRRLVQAVRWLRERGRTVVIDVDDDLSAIHPANPAFTFLNPHRAEHEVRQLLAARQVDDKHAGFALQTLQKRYTHSWDNLLEACRYASLVTVTTPGLLRRYAAHGRGVVLPNYLADHYYEVTHTDSELIGWPAALHSHPNDPAVVGNAIRRLLQDGAQFVTVGTDNAGGVARAFGLKEEPPTAPDATLLEWPAKLAHLGIGIAPLADTLFNARKSYLKPLELAAVGVPWVGSPRGEYAALHSRGTGLLAKDPRQWYQQLSRLRNSAALRQELSEAGQIVAGQLRLREHAWRWAEAWQAALDQDRQARAGAPGRPSVPSSA